MIRAILVDDEQLNVSNLKALLNKHCGSVDVVGTANSVDDSIELINKLNPDVVFLDIEMPDKNGFELLKAFQSPNFEVVFVTAYDAYGIQAIKFSALDYLLKPINIEELKASINKLEVILKHKRDNKRLQNLISLLDKKTPYESPKIALPTMKETFFVPIANILRCESSNNYTTFYLCDGTEYVISKPLYEFDEMLSPYGFIRCHQSHLVNKTHVRSIINQDAGYLMLNFGNKKIPISKQKKALIKELLSF